MQSSRPWLTPFQGRQCSRAAQRGTLVITASKAVTHKKQVILLKDVRGLGKQGELCEAPVGYVRNYLIPQRQASPASPAILARLQSERDAEAKRAQEVLGKARAMALALSTIGKFVIRKKVGTSGQLFGSVTTADVVAVIEQQTGRSLDKRAVNLPEIAALGSYLVSIRLHPGERGGGGGDSGAMLPTGARCKDDRVSLGGAW